MADERAKRIRARVESAFPLSEDTMDSLKRALGKRTGMTVELDVEVDPNLIGGIRTVGSLVFDGTTPNPAGKSSQTTSEPRINGNRPLPFPF